MENPTHRYYKPGTFKIYHTPVVGGIPLDRELADQVTVYPRDDGGPYAYLNHPGVTLEIPYPISDQFIDLENLLMGDRASDGFLFPKEPPLGRKDLNFSVSLIPDGILSCISNTCGWLNDSHQVTITFNSCNWQHPPEVAYTYLELRYSVSNHINWGGEFYTLPTTPMTWTGNKSIWVNCSGIGSKTIEIPGSSYSLSMYADEIPDYGEGDDPYSFIDALYADAASAPNGRAVGKYKVVQPGSPSFWRVYAVNSWDIRAEESLDHIEMAFKRVWTRNEQTGRLSSVAPGVLLNEELWATYGYNAYPIIGGTNITEMYPTILPDHGHGWSRLRQFCFEGEGRFTGGPAKVVIKVFPFKYYSMGEDQQVGYVWFPTS